MSTQATRQSTGILIALSLCMALQMTGFVMVLAFSGYLFAASARLLILLRGLARVFTAGLIPPSPAALATWFQRKNGIAITGVLILLLTAISQVK